MYKLSHQIMKPEKELQFLSAYLPTPVDSGSTHTLFPGLSFTATILLPER